MAINAEQSKCSGRECFCMGIKVLEPHQGKVVVNLASGRDSNNPIAR
jgi:hypothetical protein